MNRIKNKIKVQLPTEHGDFELIAFESAASKAYHLALVKGEWTKNEKVLVRIHSSCITGDIFGSCRCDCGPQLAQAMQMVEATGVGVVLYMDQEGRGIGLLNKLKAYKLQENGRDTVEANLELGFKGDERDYGMAADMLKDLGVYTISLITNNPKKRVGLEANGITVAEIVSIEISPNKHNADYLKTKKDKMGHILRF